ncbi:MAG: CDP-6-deoxy-delta-3,4-glucoseen reductase [Proteobacteria bacterium]|nr:CDP-6-deoxy-delta-3,4-glucoseen reductase [Pseudomonadota bacterium]NOG60587.1 CDP-6-deoxy-delta-3,4-glucoseen reductase [Pseudomonadota bacterium]
MSFKAELTEQNTSFTIEDDETVLEAALRQDHNLPYGCRNGACGSCKAKIVSGDINYANGFPDGISENEHQQGYALLCQATTNSDLVIESQIVESAEDIKLRQFPCRVTTCEKLNDDVIRLILELPKTERLQFLAGQYIDILMKDGKRRSFSLANPPHVDQKLELHIRYYEGGLFSEYAFKDLKDKAILRIEGPLGQFTLQESDRPIIMIAGGTGFAPVKSLIEHALEKKDYRPIYFYWGARTETDLYFDDIVKQWTCDYEHIKYIPVLSEINALNNWEGKTGFVHEAVLEDNADLSAYDIYACGPPPMINAVVKSFPEAGLNRERLFSDSFEFAAN